MTDQNSTQEPHKLQNRFSVTAFLIYLAIFVAPNGKLFIIRISENFHLTPIRFVLVILGIIATVHLITNKLNIIATIRNFRLFLPLIILVTIKIASLFYSRNYLGGIVVIEWFIECIFFATLCYIYYVRGVINLSKVIWFIIAGFALNLSVAFLQIATFFYNYNYLPSIIDYVNKNTKEINLYWITGLSGGDVNCYGTYIVGVLIILLAIFVYSKKYLLGTGILFLAGSITLFSVESRSSAIVLGLILIYLVIREKLVFERKFYLLVFILVLLFMFLFSFEGTYRFIDRYSGRYLRLIYYATKVSSIEDTSVQSHLHMLQIYNDIIEREPFAVLIGCGEGDYLGQGGDSVKGGTGAHNAYILILGENGPVALLLFIYITWLILKVSFFVNKNSSKPLSKSFLFFNLVYVFSFLIYGSQIYDYIFWMIVGLTFAEKTRIEKTWCRFPLGRH